MMSSSSAGSNVRLRDRLRRRASTATVENLFRAVELASRLSPLARPELHGVEVFRDIRYGTRGQVERKLDVYRPAARWTDLPVVLYVHGGGFRVLSKASHWLMAIAFARKGYLVFNIDYRLSPRHPYPAALEDTCAAFAWIVRHAARYGGDIDRLVLAGESAGANLVTAVAIATSYPRPEPWARAAFELGRRPRAVLPACGLLQVSDPGRFARSNAKVPIVVQDILDGIAEGYLGSAAGDTDLADPIVLLERGAPPHRPLPPFFVPVGTDDPIVDDSRRLKSALDRLETHCDLRYYHGEDHVFHTLLWRDNARRCWRDTFTFLDQHVPTTRGGESSLQRSSFAPGRSR
jgi:acetyl esterase